MTQRFDMKETIARNKRATAILPGAVFIIPDAHINFPESRNKQRPHDSRRVIVLQSHDMCGSASKPNTILVIPCTSTGTGCAARWDYVLPEGEPGFDKPRVVALVSLAQPILKADLVKYIDTLREQTFQDIKTIAMRNMGLAVDPLPIPPR